LEKLTAVNLVGRGKIGAGVAAWLATSGLDWRVVGRGEPVSPGLTLDCAGPAALRDHGAGWLAAGDVWTVGAAALIDPGLRERLAEVAARYGTRLRLFTGWISGPALCPAGVPATLHIEQSAPRLAPEPGPIFHGPLAQAAARFPDHLNTATAAALCGPGIAATTIALTCTADGGPHIIRARMKMPGQTIETEVRFGNGPHPVAQAMIAALQARGGWLAYG
jgi:predicted dinucleotide-utilizing enzyme